MAYENSKAYKKEDKKQAKKRGIPLKKWEGSKADNKMDAQAQRTGKQMKQGMY